MVSVCGNYAVTLTGIMSPVEVSFLCITLLNDVRTVV